MASLKAVFYPRCCITSIPLTQGRKNISFYLCRRSVHYIPSQESSFEVVERNLIDSLTLLTEYYVKNHLKSNASKTQVQVCAFHLRNREANRTPLRVTRSGTLLEYHPNPLYLRVKLDCTLSYRSHILSTKAKVNTRNNILRKLTNSKWVCTPHTLKASTLALCYTAAEYACPVWSRSVHASKLDPALSNACRTIIGCLKPTCWYRTTRN